MELFNAAKDDFNTELRRSDGTVLFDISTPLRTSKKISTVRRFTEAGQPTEVGTIEIPTFGDDHVVVGGKEISLQKHGVLSYKFTGPDEVQYTWKGGKELFQNDTSLVTSYEPGKTSVPVISPKETPSILKIDENVLELLDVIVMTFFYARQKHARRKEVVTGALDPLGGVYVPVAK
ncbi:hypothetical protein VKT23_009794 [Stygiomarasmius scandens]|uniref:DUF6593 domain-containing protein n=1 Tax=Marasmiellus scandens TaxID=2682957 RepID=A0ABR1JI22_9AGAR